MLSKTNVYLEVRTLDFTLARPQGHRYVYYILYGHVHILFTWSVGQNIIYLYKKIGPIR